MQNGNCSLQFSRIDRSAPDTPKSSVLFQLSDPFSGQSDSRLIQTVKKKRELFPELRQMSWSSIALPPRICTLVQETSPDSLSDNTASSLKETSRDLKGFHPFLRTDSLSTDCRSRETFLHVDPQGFHLSICYYHQDLHQWLLHPSSRKGFDA